MPTLDRSQPYSETIGIPGVSFEQNGRRFSAGGQEVVAEWARDDSGEVVVVTDVPGSAEDAPPPPSTDYEDMHWKHLKALCDTFDHPWVDKADAVAFLRGGQ